jgi:hypothetical protein
MLVKVTGSYSKVMKSENKMKQYSIVFMYSKLGLKDCGKRKLIRTFLIYSLQNFAVRNEFLGDGTEENTEEGTIWDSLNMLLNIISTSDCSFFTPCARSIMYKKLH